MKKGLLFMMGLALLTGCVTNTSSPESSQVSSSEDVVSSQVVSSTGTSSIDISSLSELAPTLTITSAKSVELELGETYTLAYDTTNDVGGVEVQVSGGSYNASTKVFSASVAGNYTLTVTVRNITLTAVDTVSVTYLPEDTEDPVLTLSSLTDVIGAVGTDIILPSATALDARDGDISADIEVVPTVSRGISITKNLNNTYTLNTLVSGTHIISYYVEDSKGNYDEKFINVIVTPSVPETIIPSESNRISNLNTSELTYVENFSRGYSSDLSKGLVWDATVKASLIGDERALAGNSLLLDYSECASNTNTSFFFGALDTYIKSGRWTIEFDVKKLEGNIPGFYVSFIFDGDNSGDNTITTTITSETTHITFNQIKSFDTTKDWHFRVFTYTGDGSFTYNNLKLVFDNFSFTYKTVEDANVSRTSGITLTNDDLDAGYTLTGVGDNYTNVSGTGQPTYVDNSKLVSGELLTSEQASLVTAENGFHSPYSILFKGQISNFDAIQGLMVDEAYDYTVTVNVLVGVAGGWYFFISNAGLAQQKATPLDSSAGLHTWTNTFGGNGNYINIGFYRDGATVLLVGDIIVSRSLKPLAETTPNGYKPGDAWHFTPEQIPTFGGNLAGTDVATSTVPVLVGQEGFGATANYYNVPGNSSMGLFHNIVEPEAKYRLTVYAYVISWTGRAMLNFDNSRFEDLGNHDAGYHKWTLDFTGGNFISMFAPDGAVEYYIGSVRLQLVNLLGQEEPQTAGGFKIGQTWSYSATQIPQWGDGGANGDDVLTSSVPALAGLRGFEGEYANHYDIAGNTSCPLFYNRYEATSTYRLVIYVYVVSWSGRVMINFDNSSFDLLEASGTPGYHAYVLDGIKGHNFTLLYAADGPAEFYIGSAVVELTKV
ncbi:MAG: hypothetical protein LBM99_02770 [Bacillales bacterium]|jgi:hypothetical protein|nr:hypothetical protein [Bacillales bacterium]